MKCLKCGTELPADNVGTCSKCANEREVNQRRQNNTQGTSKKASGGPTFGNILVIASIVFVLVLVAFTFKANINLNSGHELDNYKVQKSNESVPNKPAPETVNPFEKTQDNNGWDEDGDSAGKVVWPNTLSDNKEKETPKIDLSDVDKEEAKMKQYSNYSQQKCEDIEDLSDLLYDINIPMDDLNETNEIIQGIISKKIEPTLQTRTLFWSIFEKHDIEPSLIEEMGVCMADYATTFQTLFWSDVISSIRAKTIVKSPERLLFEQNSSYMTPERVSANDELIQKIIRGERLLINEEYVIVDEEFVETVIFLGIADHVSNIELLFKKP